jgi:hypothetical protein
VAYLIRIVEDFTHILNIGWVFTLALHPHTLVLNITVLMSDTRNILSM